MGDNNINSSNTKNENLQYSNNVQDAGEKN
jgi:hypothetical protein